MAIAGHTPRNSLPNSEMIAVENPATSEIIGHIPDLTPDQVADLARRARAAQPAGKRSDTAAERGSCAACSAG